MQELIGALQGVLRIFMNDFQIEVFKAVMYAFLVGIVYFEWRYRKKNQDRDNRLKAQEERAVVYEELQKQMQITVNTLSLVVDSIKTTVNRFITGLDEVREVDKHFEKQFAEKTAMQANFSGMLSDIDTRVRSTETRVERIEQALTTKGTTT